jgi:Family of unknown function (DUF6893)
MKALIWVITGVAVSAMAWSMAPDIRRYLKIQSM